MNSSSEDRKRAPLSEIVNSQAVANYDDADIKRWDKFDEKHWFPIQPPSIIEPIPDLPPQFKTQNVHPCLAFYKHDLKTDSLSHNDLCSLLAPENELQMLAMLQDTGVIAKEQQCKFCGGPMHMHKQVNTWYWICNRRVDGVKCNRGKFAVRDGTFFDNSHLPIGTIVWIVWHFLHQLTENQCKQYTNIGQSNCKTLVNLYAKCREVCGKWIWANKPKLGGFGQIVEMDESHFAGAPKYGRGRKLGEDPWKDWHKWVFGLTNRGSLDCVLKSVDKSRSRDVLLPLINENCADGTIFCSDGWKAYVKLSENIDLADTMNFAVNHTNNYVDPVTGAHTQTIEGLWRHCKQFLPDYGLKPKDLDSYLSAFMWFRYVKQRQLDLLKHFFTCAAFSYVPRVSKLPDGFQVNIHVESTKRQHEETDDIVQI